MMKSSLRYLIFFSIIALSCKSRDAQYQGKIDAATKLQNEGKLAASLVKINEALQIDSTGIVALYQKALTLILIKNYDSSIVYCNKAIHEKAPDGIYVELNKDNPLKKDNTLGDVEMSSILYCRGFSFYMLNKYDSALDDFEFCLAHGFNNRGAVFLYAGIIYLSKGLQKKACNYFDLATRNGNEEAKNYYSNKCRITSYTDLKPTIKNLEMEPERLYQSISHGRF